MDYDDLVKSFSIDPENPRYDELVDTGIVSAAWQGKSRLISKTTPMP